MKEKTSITEGLQRILDASRGLNYAGNAFDNLVYYCFLKYITDNNIGVKTLEDAYNYQGIQRLLAARDISGGPNCLVPVMHMIDDVYGLNGLLMQSIDMYARILFGYDGPQWEWKKKIPGSVMSALIGQIAALDLKENNNDGQIGKELVKELIENIVYQASTAISNIGSYISNSSLIELASKILKLSDTDIFCDYFSGFGVSTMQITRECDAAIRLNEQSEKAACISAMLCIISGKNKFDITFGDAFEIIVEQPFASKIFTDPPLMPAREKTFNYEGWSTKDTSIVAIVQALESLQQGGTAVITVPARILFGNNPALIDVRKWLLENKYLEAVIGLPPCWYGTNINTFLLVLSKKSSDTIVVINADDKKYYTREGKTYNLLTNECIELIITSVENKTIVNGFSNVIKASQLYSDYSFVPNQYIDSAVIEEDVTIEEINKQLYELNKRLFELYSANNNNFDYHEVIETQHHD